MDTLRIGAENFGPIAEAKVELKPLTVFVGPNNTGKSYMALLVYAISRTLSEMRTSRDRMFLGYPEDLILRGYPRFAYLRHRRMPEELLFNKRTLSALQRWLPDKWYEVMRKPTSVKRLDIPYNSLPKQITEAIDSYVASYLDSFGLNLGTELRRCYGAKLSDLVCKVDTRQTFSLLIEQEKPEVRLRFDLTGRRLALSEKEFYLRDETIRAVLPRVFWRGETVAQIEERYQGNILNEVAKSIIMNSPRKLMTMLSMGAYYLPAARSGILQGQKAIARVGLRALERAGIESISIPKLSGVVIDFLDAIYEIDKDEHGDVYKLAKHLEQKLTPGRVELIEGKQELPELYFREPRVGRLDLHRTSSMISELAPVILLLRYLVKSGNVFIIEEPEAHLHPAAQRELAKLLVLLAIGGITVLLTTHSDYLFQQISNLVALSTKPESQKEKMGYTADQLISPEKVGAYLFTRARNECGSEIRKLEVGENGISEEEFGQVAEALYSETIEARRKTQEYQSQ